MEAVGLAVGLVGIFSTCLEAVQRIDSYKTAGRDTRLLRAQLNATMHLFERWGDSVGIGKGKLSDNHHPALDDPKTFSVIKNLLESFEEFSAATTTYDATSPSAIQRVPSFTLPDPSTKNASKPSTWEKTSWALRGKLKRRNQVEALASLVSELYNIVSPETAAVASVTQKPLSPTTSVISQHDKAALVSDQNHGLAGQPCDVRAILLELQQELKAQAIRESCAWLGSPPPNHVYTESKDKRLQGTCEWMLHRQEFLNWQAPSMSDRLLWIKGPAGFGKTVLCARLVDEVEETTERPMAHFFLSSKFEGRDDPFSAIRSWLTTMISKNSIALDTIRRHHIPDYEQVASHITILRLFQDIVIKLPGCTFILDGLDECTGTNGTDSKSVTYFLEQLRKAISNTGTRLLISSRGDPIIQQGLCSFPGYTEYTIQSTDVGPDLGIYSSAVVEARLPNKDEATRGFIAQKMKDRCQGQFQWIKLQEGSLRKGRSKRQLEREIDETPSGLDGLYDREWKRIMSMGATDRDRALSLLRWAAFSMRPLTVYEITEAVLMTDDCQEFPFDEMPDSIDKNYVDSMILDLCGSLIEVRCSPVNEVERKKNDDTSGLLQHSLGKHHVGLQKVHLTHSSVKEYLLPRISLNHADSLLNKGLRVSFERLENATLSKYCICYLNLPGAWDDWQMGHERSAMRFLLYASTFWLPHYDMAGTPDTNLQDEVNAFFDARNQSFDSWRSLWRATYLTHVEGLDNCLPTGPLELAIFLRLKDVAKHIINERKYDLKHRSKHNMSALHYACALGDQETAELLIDSGSEVDIKTDKGETPLILAIDVGSNSVAELLISRGADISLNNIEGRTPLHLASRHGDLKMVKQLIESGAKIAASTNHNYTPLLYAAVNGHSEVVTLLLNEGAQLSDANENGFTSVHMASSNGHYNLVRQLVNRGADIAALTKDGYTPLMMASAKGHVEVVEILLEHGDDCRKQSKKGYSSLHLSSTNGHFEVVKLLLERGADWRYAGEEGLTSIYLTAVNNHVDVVNILLEEGASFNASRNANYGLSLLCVAAMRGFLDLAKLIINKAASVEERSVGPLEATPLCLASSAGHLEMVKLLLEKGADVNAVSTDLVTPLHEAVMNGHYDVAKLLIQEGADLSAKTEWAGFTPLIGALDKRHMEVSALLLDNGSPVTSASETLCTPLHMAAWRGDTELIQPLLDKGANIAAKDRNNNEPIHFAAQAGHLNVTRLLLQEGANATAKDLYGESALFYAAEYGHESLVELLTTEDYSELTTTDNFSRTPLHYACKEGHLQIVEWMLGMLQKTPETIDRPDYWGSTPLSMAVRKGHAGVVKLLLDTHAVDIGSTDKFGRTLDWWATGQGHSETLRLLTKQNQSRDLKGEAEVEKGESQ
ncbi:Ff.00g035730.m01.CDS01, partial [Fusarium sp. VM40]